jgi:hypothetical protein
VPGLEHLADDGGRDRQVTVRADVLSAHDDRLALPQHDRLGELTDPKLRPCRSADQRDPVVLDLRISYAARALGVILVRAVRQIEPCGIHSRGNERAQLLGESEARTEGCDDLRPAPPDHEARVLPSRSTMMRR